ncbi:hypothetical protein GY45DRAFT_1270329 [Cubamyces sp. BRFM 1775]|nr:hypothetical protein GY45DRAFT_1270329 [Cubamyces sp. BRFM 1775]
MDPLWVFTKRKAFLAAMPGKDLSAKQLEDLGGFEGVDCDNNEEKVTYLPLCETFNKVHALAIQKPARKRRPKKKRAGKPKYTAVPTFGWAESSDINEDTKPDICTYPAIPEAEAMYTLTDEERKGKVKPDTTWRSELRKQEARTMWGWMTMFIEVKTGQHPQPFLSTKDGRWVPNPHPKAKEARVQIIKYAAELQLRQHRTFVYTALICCNMVWFIRWDRAGALVSEPIDYKLDPAPLLNFVHRVTSVSAEEQGYDPTVTLATDEQVAMFQRHADELPEGWRKTYAQHALSDPGRYPICAVQCPDVPWLDTTKDKALDPDKPRTHTYLIGRYRSGYRSPTGRGGKCFIAYDVDRGCLVVLKDYWCANVSTVHRELDTYQRFHDTGVVENVAEAIAGGDVLSGDGKQQLTTSQKGSTLRVEPAERFHHRLVFRNVGRPLETYERSSELVEKVLEAIFGHFEAWQKAGVLHRDVSIGNILIDVDTNDAFLNDWDLCKYREELGLRGTAASEYGRSGTWPYLSGILLEYPRKPNELSDDLESFVYVLAICLLRFHRHNLLCAAAGSVDQPNGPLSYHIGSRYDAAFPTPSGYAVGGTEKLRAMQKADPGFVLDTSNSPQLNDLMQKLYRLGQAHYATLDFDEMEEKYGVPRAHPPPQPTNPQPTHTTNFDAIARKFGDRWKRAAAPRHGEGVDQQQALVPSVQPHSPPPSGVHHADLSLGDFNSHAHILDAIMGLDQTSWINDKTSDNFANLPRIERIESIGASGKKRRSHGDEQPSTEGPVQKKSRGGLSTGVSTTLETHVEVSPRKEREDADNRTRHADEGVANGMGKDEAEDGAQDVEEDEGRDNPFGGGEKAFGVLDGSDSDATRFVPSTEAYKLRHDLDDPFL